jgi:hypothetical protein
MNAPATTGSARTLNGAWGKSELPRLLISLPPDVTQVRGRVGAEFEGATLAVIDASPFPRMCPGKLGCIDQLAR